MPIDPSNTVEVIADREVDLTDWSKNILILKIWQTHITIRAQFYGPFQYAESDILYTSEFYFKLPLSTQNILRSCLAISHMISHFILSINPEILEVFLFYK